MTTTARAGRLPFWLPVAISSAAALIALLGMWLALSTGSPSAFVVWLFVPPVLVVIATASLVAAVLGRWRPRWTLITALAIGAALTLSLMIWSFTPPDDEPLPLGLFWGGVAAYLILTGVAVSLALAPALQRRMSPVIGRLLGFTCGLVGALVVIPATGAGAGFVIISLAVAIVSLIQWRRSKVSKLSATA